jgi:hypothetical protein
MSKEAMKLALDELKHIKQTCLSSMGISLVNEKVLTALEEALAKQEQGKPVAWFRYEYQDRIYYETKAWDDCLPLYTTPQQRTWVGLTDEELRQIWYDDEPVEGGTYVDKLRQVEAKLKEKNT